MKKLSQKIKSKRHHKKKKILFVSLPALGFIELFLFFIIAVDGH